MKIIVKPSPKVSAIPKKLDISKVSQTAINHRNVADIDSCNNYDRVSICAKVFRIQPPIKVAGGLTKQEVTVADNTGAIKVTLWENLVGCGILQDESSYELNNLIVRTYKYLSIRKVLRYMKLLTLVRWLKMAFQMQQNK